MDSLRESGSSVSKMYNIPEEPIFRLQGRTLQGSMSDPWDLSACVESNSPIWKAGWMLSELGLSDDQLDIFRGERPGGLANMGATCYVNSCIQSLYFNRDFRQLILSLAPSEGSALGAFQSLIAELAYSIKRIVSPVDFLEQFSIKHNLQEDSAEFNTLLVNWLDKQVGDGRVRNLFEGEFEHTTKCESCDKVTSKKERFLEIRLSVNPEVSDVDSMISEIFRDERIEGYRCTQSGCGKVGSAVRQCRIIKLPKYLRLVLGRYRFSLSKGRQKISDAISIPLKKLRGLSDNSSYECACVLEHHSEKASSGHYTASVRDEKDSWWQLDDGSVEGIELNAKKGAAKVCKWTADRCLSDAAYVVIYEDRNMERMGWVGAGNSALSERIKVENDAIAKDIQVKMIRKQEIQEMIENRQHVLKNSSFTADMENFFVVSSEYVRKYARGDDIRSPSSEWGMQQPACCAHGKIDLLSVLRGAVKFVPASFLKQSESGLESSSKDSLCKECVAEFQSQLARGIKYFANLEYLNETQFDALSLSFTGVFAHDSPVWISKRDIPKVSASFKKWFASEESLKRKITFTESTSTRSHVDISEGVVCRHGVFSVHPSSDENLALKPKSLVETLRNDSSDLRDDLFWFAPKITASHLIDFTASSGIETCRACSLEDQDLSDLKHALRHIGTEITAKDLVVSLRYFALPTEWVNKLRKWIDGHSKAPPRTPPQMLSLVCPHNDLRYDILSHITERRTNTTPHTPPPFSLVSEEDMQVLKSKNFPDFSNCCIAPDSVFPVIEKDRTYTISVCPLVCPLCHTESPSDTVSSRISLRVFHETINRLDGGSNRAIKVKLNETTVLYRPGRSRLVGSVPDVDLSALGLDLKLLLIDIGILEQSPFFINPEDALDRIHLYILHPLIRGSLVLIKDDVSIRETLQNLSSQTDTVDTVFVEFVKCSLEGTPKRLKHNPPSDADAGLQGSILRE